MATCTITIAAVAGSPAVDANFIDPSVVSRFVEDVANNINLSGTPVSGSGTVTTNLNNYAVTISYTVVNT
jgi:hypothetical protein